MGFTFPCLIYGSILHLAIPRLWYFCAQHRLQGKHHTRFMPCSSIYIDTKKLKISHNLYKISEMPTQNLKVQPTRRFARAKGNGIAFGEGLKRRKDRNPDSILRNIDFNVKQILKKLKKYVSLQL